MPVRVVEEAAAFCWYSWKATSLSALGPIMIIEAVANR